MKEEFIKNFLEIQGIISHSISSFCISKSSGIEHNVNTYICHDCLLHAEECSFEESDLGCICHPFSSLEGSLSESSTVKTSTLESKRLLLPNLDRKCTCDPQSDDMNL